MKVSVCVLCVIYSTRCPLLASRSEGQLPLLCVCVLDGGTLARMLAQCLNFVFATSLLSRPYFAALRAAATLVVLVLHPLTAAHRCHVVLGVVPNYSFPLPEWQKGCVCVLFGALTPQPKKKKVRLASDSNPKIPLNYTTFDSDNAARGSARHLCVHGAGYQWGLMRRFAVNFGS